MIAPGLRLARVFLVMNFASEFAQLPLYTLSVFLLAAALKIEG